MAKKSKEELDDENIEVIDEVKVEIQENKKSIEDELKEKNEQYLRLAAEYENFRKRAQRERDGLYSDVKANIVTEFLPVIDNFERANSSDSSSDEYKKGIDMTYNQLLDILAKLKVESFGEKGEKFDPQLHNAVMHVEDETLGENTVADVFAKGYKLGEKVLRTAMVKVAN